MSAVDWMGVTMLAQAALLPVWVWFGIRIGEMRASDKARAMAAHPSLRRVK